MAASGAWGHLARRLPALGFELREELVGWHRFEEGQGPPGRLPLRFRLRWGADDLRAWAAPGSETFLAHWLEGRVSAGGLCEDAPCEGSLLLRYCEDHSICYRFRFEAGGRRLLYEGAKVEIRWWNLPVSHTTCFGTLVDEDTGRLVSRSVVRFRLSSLPAFLASFRLRR